MRKQSGFTLIELMVVMAIIAILATAGLSAYGWYLKKARDATRIEDIRAINAIVLASLPASGIAPDRNTIIANMSAMNNGISMSDPLNWQLLCLNGAGTSGYICEYRYGQCDNGWYILRMKFESASNIARYAAGQDELPAGAANSAHYYDLGSCDSVTALTEWAI